MKPSRLPSYLALGIGSLSLGFSAIFVRWANAPGSVTAFYRVAIAVLLLAWPFYRRVKTRGSLPREGLRFAVLGGMFFAADLSLWATGVVMSGATNPTLLANTAPLWVGLGALVLFRERLTVMFWAGLLLAMAGAVVILGLDSAQNPCVSFILRETAGAGFWVFPKKLFLSSAQNPCVSFILRETAGAGFWVFPKKLFLSSVRAASFGLGTLLGLFAGVFYGGYFLITQRGRETLDSLTYFWPAAASSTLALLVLNLALGQPLTGYSVPTYLNFVALGLIPQVLGYLSINYALGHLPASVVAPTMLGQPIVTAILAGPLLGEALSVWQALGGVAVLAGVYVVHRSRQGGDV